MAANFREIKADILRKIMQGEWKPGALLPNETSLAASYDSARTTVNRAMRELAADGIIERKRKAGSRVRTAPLRQARFHIPIVRKEVEDLGLSYSYLLLLSEIIAVPAWLRSRLGLRPGSRMRHLHCLHKANDLPFQHEDRWINLSLLPQAATHDFSASGPNEWLVAQIPFSEVEITISAAAADATLASRLGCAKGDSLLQIERSTRWEAQPVTFVRLAHRHGHSMTTRY